jgi:SepF-like predicted cell division protein (DUF552 family)
MKKLFSQFKNRFTEEYSEDFDEPVEEEYVELDTEIGFDKESKITVRPFVITDFSDVKEVLESIREGYTIALINIKPIKEKDLIELKRVVNKLKKTCDAIEGDIAGFGEDYIVVTPGFASIYRSKQTNNIEE